MDMSVAVPSYLLQGIFRLIDYLAAVSDRDDLHFHKAGYSQLLERDNALWELKFKIRQLHSHIVDTYLLTVDAVAQDELDALNRWVAGGGSVYDNPYSLYDDSGLPMDFINGCRIAQDLALHFCAIRHDDDGDRDGDIPF